MNKHFKYVYINILKNKCKVSFRDGTIYLDYKYPYPYPYPGCAYKWQARIKDGKFFHGDCGEEETELINE